MMTSKIQFPPRTNSPKTNQKTSLIMKTKTTAPLCDITKTMYGYLLVETVNSNPNGDPDNDGAPRVIGLDGTSTVSLQSIRRKVRDHILYRTPTFMAVCKELGITDAEIEANYNIYVESSRPASAYATEFSNDPSAFYDRYWDARLFGHTLLGGDSPKKGGPTHKAGGPLFGGMLESLQPVEIYTATLTRAQGTTPGKDRDIAPNGIRVVRYGLYGGRFGFSPDLAAPHRTRDKDVALFLALLPFVYNFKAANRAQTEVVQIWTVEKPLTVPLSHAKFVSLVAPQYIGETPDVAAVNREQYRFAKLDEVQKAINAIPACKDVAKVSVIDLI